MTDETDKDHAETVRKAVRRGYELRRDVGPELVETARTVAFDLRALAGSSLVDGQGLLATRLREAAKSLDLHVRRADGLIAQNRYAITWEGRARPMRWTAAWTPEQAKAKFVHEVGGSPPAEELTAVEEPR